MRARGMTYDTGWVRDGRNLLPDLDEGRMRRDLTVIRDDLHCTAIQLVGGDPDRLEAAAHLAAGLGLEVWFSPYPLDLTPAETRALLLDCARRAAGVRGEVVFVAGVELSLMTRGFVDGDRIDQRLAHLFGDRDPAAVRGRVADVSDRLRDFFRTAVPAIRDVFPGRVTYAAIQFEDVDWSLFDIVTLELIRSAEVAGRFREAVRTLAAGPKPLAVTGFGTATWRGAADVAPRSMDIVEYDERTGFPLRLTAVHERDEAGQAAYLDELLEIFGSEGVDSAFVHLFALRNLPHRPAGDPRDDLDLASLGIVRVLEDGRWEPKEAFAAVAARYGRLQVCQSRL